MQMLLQQIVNGLAIGSSYTLVAVGFTLIFGVLRVVYLAQGAVLVAGSYLGLLALARSGSILVALLAGTIGAGVLGLVVEVVAVRSVRRENPLIPLVTTVSAATIISEVLRLGVEHGQPVAYPPTASSRLLSVTLGGIALHVTVGQLFVGGMALALVVALTLMVRHTWLGRSIRAVAESPTIASLLGVNVNSVSAETVARASALAGAAGVLLGLTIPAIDPYFGEPLQFKALAIVLFAGLGSLPGAVLGGLLLGIAEAVAAGYLDSSYRDLFVYGTMVAILFVRPSGLLGRAVVQRV